MFHKVKSVAPLSDFKLSVQFSEGVTKLYDVKPLFETISAFRYLKDNPSEFDCVSVDVCNLSLCERFHPSGESSDSR